MEFGAMGDSEPDWHSDEDIPLVDVVVEMECPEEGLNVKPPVFKLGAGALKRGELPPCSTECRGLAGKAPTLLCRRCNVLYHRHCLGLPSNHPGRNYLCRNCDSKDRSGGEKIRRILAAGRRQQMRLAAQKRRVPSRARCSKSKTEDKGREDAKVSKVENTRAPDPDSPEVQIIRVTRSKPPRPPTPDSDVEILETTPEVAVIEPTSDSDPDEEEDEEMDSAEGKSGRGHESSDSD